VTAQDDGFVKQIIVHWGAAAVAGIFGLVIGLISAAWATRSRDATQDVETKRSMENLERRLASAEQIVSQKDQELASALQAIKRLQEQAGGTNKPVVPTGSAPLGLVDNTPPPMAKERLAPFDITLQKCAHAGGGLDCELLLDNTNEKPASLALMNEATSVFANGTERPLREATLGSQRWSAHQFGAIRVESGIPLVAQLRFSDVPETSHAGALRFVVAVVQSTGPQAFFGPNPEWQSVVFKDVNFQ
jgi:hypothetical protein